MLCLVIKRDHIAGNSFITHPLHASFQNPLLLTLVNGSSASDLGSRGQRSMGRKFIPEANGPRLRSIRV
jgi:hypothetical protein